MCIRNRCGWSCWYSSFCIACDCTNFFDRIHDIVSSCILLIQIIPCVCPMVCLIQFLRCIRICYSHAICHKLYRNWCPQTIAVVVIFPYFCHCMTDFIHRILVCDNRQIRSIALLLDYRRLLWIWSRHACSILNNRILNLYTILINRQIAPACRPVIRCRQCNILRQGNSIFH